MIPTIEDPTMKPEYLTTHGQITSIAANEDPDLQPLTMIPTLTILDQTFRIDNNIQDPGSNPS